MHIEPGVVSAIKLPLSYAVATLSFSLAATHAVKDVRADGVGVVVARCAMTTGLVLGFFQVLPHHAVGVSEVHLILGSTLFLLFGSGAAAFGLALGLLLQGLVFAPQDLPQYGMNVTTLLAPLMGMSLLAKRIIPRDTRYADLTYGQALKLSTAYQGGVVAWVCFWALYGQGFSVHTLAAIAAFGLAYSAVVLIEPLVDLAVLATAKGVRAKSLDGSRARVALLCDRLWRPASAA